MKTTDLTINRDTHYIHNIDTILLKINKATFAYSKLKNLEKYEYNQEINVKNSVGDVVLYIHRLDMYKIFKNTGFYNVYKNSPKSFVKGHTLYEVLYKYTALYHTPYLYIDNFINMLLYKFPKELDRDYFHEFNLLYKKIKSHPDAKSNVDMENDENYKKIWNELFSNNIVTRKSMSTFYVSDINLS